MKRVLPFAIALSLLFSSCNSATQSPAPKTAPTGALVPSATPTLTVTPSPTDMPTSTPIPRMPITASSINDLQLIRSYGEQIKGEDIAWAPNGKLIALATQDGISFYDSAILGQQGSIKIDWLVPKRAFSVSPVRGMMISPDSTSILAVRDNGKGSVFDIATGKEKLMFNILSSVSKDFCPEDEILTSYTWWRRRIFCIPKDAENTFSSFIQSNIGQITMTFSPDYKLAARGGQNGVEIVSLDGGKLVSSLWSKSYGWGMSASFSPDGKTLAAGFDQGLVKLFNSVTGEEIKSVSLGRAVLALNFNNDGSLLAVTTEIGSYLVDVQNFKATKIGADNPGDVVDIAFSPDGNIMATVNTANTLMLWNTRTGMLIFQQEGKSYEWQWPFECDIVQGGQVAYSHDGKILAFGETDGIYIFDTANMSIVSHLKIDKGYPSGLEFSSDDKYLAVGIASTWVNQENSIPGGMIYTVGKWDTSFSLAGNPVSFPNNPYLKTSTFNCVDSIAFTSDNKYLLSAGDDGSIKVWDVASEEEIQQLSNLIGEYIAFNPSNNEFATGGDLLNLVTTIWQINDNQIGRHPKISLDRGAKSLAFSPDGELLVVSYVEPYGLKIWDIKNQKMVFKFLYNEVFIDSRSLFANSKVAFSPDSSLIAASTGTKLFLFGVK